MRDLEFRLGEDRTELRLLAANWKDEYDPFTKTSTPKPFQSAPHTPKPRQIDNPSDRLKAVQKKIQDRILSPIALPDYMYGGVSGRTIKDHANVHIGAKALVKMDIKSYFPSITSRHVYSVWHGYLHYSSDVSRLLTQLTTFNWHLPQGAPTSTALANLYLASIYQPIIDLCESIGIKPTTWIDDLTFSGERVREIMEPVREILAKHGFKLSRRKCIILSGTSAKNVTGVRIGQDHARAERTKLRDIRAAIHKLEIGCIPQESSRIYVTKLKGRVNHISQVCEMDAAPLIARLDRWLNMAKQA
jgi:hypothetical protein